MSARRLRIPDEVQTFGQAVRWAREQRGKTLRGLAREMGITAPAVCDIEHDRRSTSRVEQIATILQVEQKDLEARLGTIVDLKDWLSKNPKLIALLRDIKAQRCSPIIIYRLAEAARKARPSSSEGGAK